MSFLIYGANGYTGKLIIETAIQKGLRPVIAGRTENKIKPLAKEFGLEYLVFDLDNVSEVAKHLEKFPLVLNCAGPFSKTAKPMVEACLLSKTKYLDITGEIGVFELVKSYHKKAVEKQILLMPGVGFDVVPTDCVASLLHAKLPDATHLELAFMNLGGGLSHGTVSTIIENLGSGGAIRENGKIISKPIGHKGKWIDFGKKKRFAMTIPWGDVSTAFHTTGIPNIEVYSATPKSTYNLMKFQFLFNPLLRTNFVKRLIQKSVDKKISGPTKDQNEKGRSLVWGMAENATGKIVEARLETPAGYLLTAEMAIHITQKILASNTNFGYHTPAGLFGHKLILEIAGTNFVGE